VLVNELLKGTESNALCRLVLAKKLFKGTESNVVYGGIS
jgi:hypothetical protein